MVFNKLKEKLSSSDEKYEVLYYKYSKIKLENQKLKDEHLKDMKSYKDKVQEKVAKDLIALYEASENTKNDSFKVKASSPELQRLLMSINASEKKLKKLMTDFSLEEVTPQERFFDPEIHEIASYEDANGMAKGLLLKTVKKGFRFKGDIIKKPRVVVTK